MTNQFLNQRKGLKGFASAGLGCVLAIALLWTMAATTPFRDGPNLWRHSNRGGRRTLVVWSDFQDNPVAAKQYKDLQTVAPSDLVHLELQVLDGTQQREYVRTYCGSRGVERYDEFAGAGHGHLAIELWKYCALHSQSEAAVYVDMSSPFTVRLQEPLGRLSKSIAILGDSYLRGTIHGSFLVLQKDQLHIASKIYQLLLQTSTETLVKNPVLIPRALYALIAASEHAQSLSFGMSDSWYLLELQCIMSAHTTGNFHWMAANSRRLVHHCPDDSMFCCSIYDNSRNRVVQMTRNPIHPLATQPSHLELPYNARQGNYRLEDLPFVSVVREVTLPKPNVQGQVRNPGLFDTLLRHDCLPSEKCNDCLRDNPDGCDGCFHVCACYCRTLCKLQVDQIPVTKRLIVAPPLHSFDPDRLIPPIIHQLTPDNLSESTYWFPDTSRTVRSFQMAGWEHRSYLMEDAAVFLETHFPPEVKEAYDALTSEKNKIDLFRYCVLLIYGGMYANPDILLESALDFVIDADIGFVASTDNRTEGCLWQGFLAAAPGHPFVAKAIESMVNLVRNRYMLVDVDATLCPSPNLYWARRDKSVAASGSCLLAKSVNWVLARSPETMFSAGEVDVKQHRCRGPVPGRVAVLRGYNDDMGGHRLTLEQKNAVVAEADLPVELQEQRREPIKKLEAPYDFKPLYKNVERSNEDIVIEIAPLLQVNSRFQKP